MNEKEKAITKFYYFVIGALKAKVSDEFTIKVIKEEIERIESMRSG